MFQSVLVPLDGTSFSEGSLALAELVGRGPDTRLHLVSVGREDASERGYLADVAERLRGSSLQVDEVVVRGKIVDALEQHAKKVGADLIVMATHGRSGLERLRLGSVAEGLVTRGVAPILLIHPGPEGPSPEVTIDHVAIALDASAYAQTILPTVETLGAATGVSRYTIVHVAESKGAGKAGWSPASAVQVRAQEHLGAIRDRLGTGGAEVDLRVVMSSDPSEGILGVAEEVGADLIAMTTHGMTGLRPTLMGSVAAAVLHGWHGPLLLRRPQA
jgi:nucleotide-binding universal stress UspA family protein